MYITIFLSLIGSLCFASDHNISLENNISKKAEKNIQKQIELEKKYKNEQKFYMGDEYDLKSKEVDKSSLKDIPVIEPEYDFDITDLYSD